MIPKIIHYCWFGNGQLPDLVTACLNSWKKHLPDFEIIVWNEENFDINQYTFAVEAYHEKKFAFVADVCRLHALKVMGGLYLDTDVEFLKPLSPEILNNNAFTGFEGNSLLSSAIMASEKNGKWVTELLAYYQNKSFYLADGKLDINPNTEIITAFMVNNKGLKIDNSFHHIENYCTIYPSEYFSPKSWKTLKINLTPSTYCIHHFAGSWIHDKPTLLGKIVNLILGKQIADLLSAKYRKVKSNFL